MVFKGLQFFDVPLELPESLYLWTFYYNFLKDSSCGYLWIIFEGLSEIIREFEKYFLKFFSGLDFKNIF